MKGFKVIDSVILFTISKVKQGPQGKKKLLTPPTDHVTNNRSVRNRHLSVVRQCAGAAQGFVILQWTVYGNMAATLICGRLAARLRNSGSGKTLSNASKVSVSECQIKQIQLSIGLT